MTQDSMMTQTAKTNKLKKSNSGCMYIHTLGCFGGII